MTNQVCLDFAILFGGIAHDQARLALRGGEHE